MFAKIARSWEFAKISYGILWDFKSLLFFPIFSILAAGLVMASFIVPLASTGAFELWRDRSQMTAGQQAVALVVMFLFYFCSYFVMIFFNAGLTACAMKVIRGETPTIGYGLWIASRRLPQIAGWAFVSAIVGMILKIIESTSKRLGRFIAAVMGSAWTAMTFFVVPAIVVEGLGPIQAFKKSVGTLHGSWGERVIGGFSIGLMTTLLAIPIVVLGFVLITVVGLSHLSLPMALAILALMGMAIFVLVAASSAANVIFQTLLYNYASGRMIPDGIDISNFDEAFQGKEWQS